MLAGLRQPGGGHHRLRLRPRFHQRPSPGPDLLRPAFWSPPPEAGECGGVGGCVGPYIVADKGFEGEENHRRWLESYGGRIVCPPKRNGRKKRRWPKRLRRWAASIRQIIETVYEKLHDTFALRRERPHDMAGLRARLAAREGCAAQLLHLAQRTTRPSSVSFRRFAGLMRSQPTPSVVRVRSSLPSHLPLTSMK